jgi:hypothetical protein
VKVKLVTERNRIFQHPRMTSKIYSLVLNITWTLSELWQSHRDAWYGEHVVAIVHHSIWFLLNRDKLNNLCRQKEKLEEKIMEHYRKLDSCSTKKWVPSPCVVYQSKKFSCTWKILNLGFIYIFPVITFWEFDENVFCMKKKIVYDNIQRMPTNAAVM